jgi:predicted flap endonuclease-1-like 5' DNA nuclease
MLETHSGFLKFIRLGIHVLDDMSPVIVVAGFVVLLALLLYYMYKEKAEGEAPPEEQRMEPLVVEDKKHETPLTAEKPAEAPEAEQSEKPEPEPAEPRPEAPQPEKPKTQTEDLDSLSGVGEKYRALLRAAGVRSVATLAGEEPAALLERLREANEREDLVKRLPRAGDVEAWVRRAKEQSL